MDKYNNMALEAQARRDEARRKCWERYNKKKLDGLFENGKPIGETKSNS